MRRFCLTLTLLLGFATPSAGQTIRDEVREHVEQSLQEEKEKANRSDREAESKTENQTDGSDGRAVDKKSEEHERPDARTGAAHGEHEKGKSAPHLAETQKTKSVRADEPEEQPLSFTLSPPGMRREGLPRRVIHKWLKIDLRSGVGYRGWLPQQYSNVNVDMASYFTWSVSITARLFDVVSLTRGRYESNGLYAPRTPYLASAAKYGSYGLRAAWFLAELGVSALKTWQPVVRYEARSFRTRAENPSGDLCVVPFEQSADEIGCQTTETSLSVVSGFENAILGVRYNPARDLHALTGTDSPRLPSFLFGLAYASYIKPYQVTIGESVLDKYLFTGRFYGGGLALGAEAGGGINSFYLSVSVHPGLGAVRLTKDMTLNELAPQDWLIGYLQGNARLSFQWAPFDFAPTLLIVPSVGVSGATFFFFETDVDEGEKTATPNVNWDLLYTARLGLMLTL